MCFCALGGPQVAVRVYSQNIWHSILIIHFDDDHIDGHSIGLPKQVALNELQLGLSWTFPLNAVQTSNLQHSES